MTVEQGVALAIALASLAAVPSLSVFVVVTQTLHGGRWSGVMTALGIVLADLLYVLFALGGWAILVKVLGQWILGLRLIGALYLIVIGVGLLRSQERFSGREAAPTVGGNVRGWSSLATGFFLTLGDQKAILFYLGFFPAFVNIKQLSQGEFLGILGITAIAVGGVKVLYVFGAEHARVWLGDRVQRGMNYWAGGVMLGVGLWLLAQCVGLLS